MPLDLFPYKQKARDWIVSIPLAATAGIIGFAADWKVTLGAALGAFVAHMVTRPITRLELIMIAKRTAAEAVVEALSVHESVCAIRGGAEETKTTPLGSSAPSSSSSHGGKDNG